jgi:quinol-cytochrome oxidoreductase complex cytochrome b subunit
VDQGRDHLHRECHVSENDQDQEGLRSRFLKWLEDATDSRILAIPRFFGFLYGPIEDRLPLGQAWKTALKRRLPRHVGWIHAFGGTTYLLFLILVVTGVLLSFYYRPSVVEAYPSLQYLESQVSFGWLVRHAHFWAGSLVVILSFFHFLRVLVSGGYRSPRETTWLSGILFFPVLLAFVTSGYLLPWDQWAYWTTTDGIEALRGLPVLGGILTEVFRADEFVSGATLSRFYATHVILLPWVALLLISLHFQLMRKHGVDPPRDGVVEEGEPFFPNHVLRMFVALVLTLGVVLSLAMLWPRPFGPVADPFSPPASLPVLGVPATILVGAGHLWGGFGLYALLFLFFLLLILPLVHRSDERSLLRRPVAVSITGVLILLLLTSLAVGWSPPGSAEDYDAVEIPALDAVRSEFGVPADTGGGGGEEGNGGGDHE